MLVRTPGTRALAGGFSAALRGLHAALQAGGLSRAGHCARRSDLDLPPPAPPAVENHRMLLRVRRRQILGAEEVSETSPQTTGEEQKMRRINSLPRLEELADDGQEPSSRREHHELRSVRGTAREYGP